MYFVNNKSGFIHSCMFSTGRTKKFSKSWGHYQLRCQYFLLQKGDIQICHCFRKKQNNKDDVIVYHIC